VAKTVQFYTRVAPQIAARTAAGGAK